MGKPRKPTKLHVIHGTLRTTRHGDRTAEPITGAMGAAPEWFGAIARAEWDRIMGNEVCRQMVQFSDRADFEHYCVLYERFVLDAKEERHMGASERQTFHSLCMQLGFTPAARSKVAMPQKPINESPWDKVANR